MTELGLAAACPHCGTALPPAGACGATCGTAYGSLFGAPCGAGGGCALLSCPGCGSALPHPRRSPLAWALAQWLERRARRKAAAADTLAALPAGVTAQVVALGRGMGASAQQLAAWGLVPGARVRLRQRRPALVLEVGETTLALDAALAREIRVRRPGPADGPPVQPEAPAQPSSGSAPS
jgi:Fe2+ transport system protein FeoA